MRRYSERKAHVHAAGVALHWRVKEFLYLGELHDLIELCIYLALSHSQDRAVEIDVLPAIEFGMEASAHFEEACHTPMHGDPAFSGLCDAREDLEESALSGAVPAYDAHDLSFLHLEGYVLERPEGVVIVIAPEHFKRGLDYACNAVLQGPVSPVHSYPVLLGQVLDFDHGMGHRIMYSPRLTSSYISCFFFSKDFIKKSVFIKYFLPFSMT